MIPQEFGKNVNLRRFTHYEYPISHPFVWNFMQPIRDPNMSHGLSILEYDDAVAQFAIETVCRLDREIQTHIRSGLWQFMVKTDIPWETSRAQYHVVEEVKKSMLSGDTTCIAALHGATPAVVDLYNDPDMFPVRDRIATAIISGYSSTNGEVPKIVTPIPNRILQADLVHVLDDVGHTLKTVGVVLCAIEQEKFGFTDEQIVHELTTSEHVSMYDALIQRMHKAGLVASLLFYKNDLFLERLEAYLETANNDNWSRSQEAVYPHARRYSREYWHLGHFIDIGLAWNGDLFNEANPFEQYVDSDWFLKDPLVARLIDQLSQSSFRIGATMEGMYGLLPEYVPWFKKYVAQFFANAILTFAERRSNTVA